MSQINYTVDRVVQMKDDGQVVRFIKGSIKSTDTKPTIGIYDRSTLYEEDTGNYYVFNQRLNKWQLHDPDDGNEGSGGGSGSGIGGGLFKINKDGDDTLDKTWQEIYDAYLAGKSIWLETVGVDGAHDFLPIDSISYIESDNVHGYVVAFDVHEGYACLSPNEYPKSQK